MKLTKWFGAEVRPIYAGIYEVEGLPAPYLYWTGKEWRGAWQNMPIEEDELQYACTAGYAEYLRWRGLAEDPNGSKL